MLTRKSRGVRRELRSFAAHRRVRWCASAIAQLRRGRRDYPETSGFRPTRSATVERQRSANVWPARSLAVRQRPATSDRSPGRGRQDGQDEDGMTDFLIDTDTASDDAVALILALRTTHVRLRGITCVAGNVSATQAGRNACLVAELCGADVPVFVGCDRPMLRDASDASWFHGRDGLSDIGLVPARKMAEAMHGVDALLAMSREHPGADVGDARAVDERGGRARAGSDVCDADRAMRGDGREPVLRRQRHAGGGIQRLVRPRGGRDRLRVGHERRNDRLAPVARRRGAERGRDRRARGERHAAGAVRDRLQSDGDARVSHADRRARHQPAGPRRDGGRARSVAGALDVDAPRPYRVRERTDARGKRSSISSTSAATNAMAARGAACR